MHKSQIIFQNSVRLKRLIHCDSPFKPLLLYATKYHFKTRCLRKPVRSRWIQKNQIVITSPGDIIDGIESHQIERSTIEGRFLVVVANTGRRASRPYKFNRLAWDWTTGCVRNDLITRQQSCLVDVTRLRCVGRPRRRRGRWRARNSRCERWRVSAW